MDYLPRLIGALLPAWALSRALRYLLRPRLAEDQLLEVSHLVAATVAVVIAAFGNADGGPPRFLYSASIHLPAQIMWYAFDRWRRSRVPPASPGVTRERTPDAPPTPGEWRWGVTCEHCGAFTPMTYDNGHGNKRIQFRGVEQRLECSACGRSSAFAPDRIHSEQL